MVSEFAFYIRMNFFFPEVARTRLREEGGSRGLWKTFKSLCAENGYRTLYRGLSVQVKLLIYFENNCELFSAHALCSKYSDNYGHI